MPVLDAVDGEVAVKRENRSQAEPLRQGDERGVGEVHRFVGIFLHQFERALKNRIVDMENLQLAFGDEIPEPLRANAPRPQQMKSLRQDRDGRRDRLFDRFEGFDASLVAAVGGVEQRNQWTGIDQDYRLCFSPITAATAVFARLAGATA